MGSLTKEPAATLVRDIASMGFHTFVETGTYLGGTTAFAAQIFPRAITIEIRQDFQKQAKANCAHLSNIEYVLGDSSAALAPVVQGLDGPALFWLDGHAGGGNFGDKDHCPVLAELAAIAQSPFEHVIIIDDARGFLAPPPPPFDAEVWPPIWEVLQGARARHNLYCVVITDMIVCVPEAMRQMIVKYCAIARPKI